jgi:O-antigen ligase/tetratricopeptide (TPR) repeat protein
VSNKLAHQNMAKSDHLINEKKISYEIIAVIFLVIFPAIAYGAVETWSMTVIHLMVISSLAITSSRLLSKRKILIYRSPIDAFILIFFTLEIISIFGSAYPYNSYISILKSISYIIIFYYVINNIRTKKQLILLAQTIVIFASLYATIALTLISDDFLGFKNFSNNEYITLTFVNRNHFAGFLEMVVWLAVGLAYINKGAKRILYLFLATYMASAIFFSLSRGGMIGFTSSIFFISAIIFFVEKKKKHLLLIAEFTLLLTAIILMIGIDPIITRLSTLHDPEVAGQGRLEYWASTYKMIANNLWLGTGLGTYSAANPEYKTVYAANLFVSHAHNDYLELAAEMGIIGFLSFATMLIALFYRIIKLVKAQSDKTLRVMGIIILTSIFSIIIHSVTDFNFHIPSNVILFTIISAMAINMVSISSTTDKKLVLTISGTKKRTCIFISLALSFLFLYLTMKPFMGEFYFKQAQEKQKTKEYSKAIKSLEQAIQFNFGNPEYYANIADINYAKSLIKSNSPIKDSLLNQALSFYNIAINKNPTNSYYYSKKAFVSQALGHIQKAEKAFLSAIQYLPNSAYTHYNLANFYYSQKLYDKAGDEYFNSLELKATYLKPIVNTLLEANNDYDYIKTIIPQKPRLRWDFAQILWSKKLVSAAIQELELAFQLEPNEANAEKYISRLKGMKHYDKAEEKCKEFTLSYPNKLHFKTLLANIYLSKHQYKVADSLLNSYLSVDPENYILEKQLATIYTYEKKYIDAIKTYSKLLKNQPSEASIYYSLSVCYRHINEKEKVLDNLKKAVYYQPNNAYYHYYLAMEYKSISLYSLAITHLKKSIELNPNKKSFQIALNSIYATLQINE